MVDEVRMLQRICGIKAKLNTIALDLQDLIARHNRELAAIDAKIALLEQRQNNEVHRLRSELAQLASRSRELENGISAVPSILERACDGRQRRDWPFG
ncbi:hypothetical protein BST61_g10382 [Cercospora zeina]